MYALSSEARIHGGRVRPHGSRATRTRSSVLSIIRAGEPADAFPEMPGRFAPLSISPGEIELQAECSARFPSIAAGASCDDRRLGRSCADQAKRGS